MRAHGAVASHLLGADWETVERTPSVQAALDFITSMMRDEPDVDAILAAGVSPAAVRDAAYVCGLFSMITAVANELEWEVPPTFDASVGPLVRFGYRLPLGL